MKGFPRVSQKCGNLIETRRDHPYIRSDLRGEDDEDWYRPIVYGVGGLPLGTLPEPSRLTALG